MPLTFLYGTEGADLEAAQAAGSLLLGGWMHKGHAAAEDLPEFQLLACNTTDAGCTCLNTCIAHCSLLGVS